MRLLSFAIATMFTLQDCKRPSIQNLKVETISIVNMECGSKMIKEGKIAIGYISRPFFVEPYKPEDFITAFEKENRSRFAGVHENLFRVYQFSVDPQTDTILSVIFLAPKQASKLQGWECNSVDLKRYFRNSRKWGFGARRPQILQFNCNTKAFLK